MKKQATAVSVLVLGSALASVGGGCASIVQGEHEGIYFDSSPQGAAVEIEGTRGEYIEVTTPAMVQLKRWQSHDVTVSAPGYPSQSFRIQSELSPWVWGNLLFGGIIGGLIDWGTGAWGNLTPNGVFVDFYDGTHDFRDPRGGAHD